MQHARANISPGEFNVERVVCAVPRNGQGEGDGVELRRLLEEVVVVVGLPAHGGGCSFVELAAERGGIACFFHAAEDGDASCVHPELDEEGPAVEGNDGPQQAGDVDGRHGDKYVDIEGKKREKKRKRKRGGVSFIKNGSALAVP